MDYRENERYADRMFYGFLTMFTVLAGAFVYIIH